MRISIPDDYQNCITSLDAYRILYGHDVTIINEYISDTVQLANALNDPEAIILTRTRTRITPELLNLLPNLKVISQTGKNAGHIDVDACEDRGITILEGRGDPTATAELTWTLIMNVLRKLPQAIEGMKAGHWQTNIGRRVAGKTIGIWGYGRIGKKIAQYASVFDAQVVVWGSKESRLQAIQDGHSGASDKASFFANCDVISLHLRLKPATNNIIKKEDLLLMKRNAILINTARAGLIEEGALLSSLISGHPGFAAIDVYNKEPIYNTDHPLLKMSNVICTPHIGYVELSSYELYFGIAFENLMHFIKDNSEIE